MLKIAVAVVAFLLLLAGPARAELSDADLDKAIAPLLGDDRAQRKAAAKALGELGPDAVPAVSKKLAELRKTPAPAVTSAVKAARDATKPTELDLRDMLVEAKADTPGWKTAVTVTALASGLAHAGTTPATRQLVKLAVDHGGAYRLEVARHVKALGDRAVPALLETKKESNELRHWGYGQLEGMGKRVAADAVQMQDNRVLADVLQAFAVVHEMDALPVLLSFVNSDRLEVRSAARDALLAYGQDAVWKLREAYANVTAKPAPETWTATQTAKELFAAYDRLRLQEVYGLLDDGIARYKEGRLEDAVAAFDKVLARQPMIDRRSEMMAAYADLAMKLEESDPPRAMSLFKKALRLWPESARAAQLQSEIAFLEGKDLEAHGIEDAEPYKRALGFDPTHAKARAELTRFESRSEERTQRLRLMLAAAVAAVVAFVGLVLFVRAPRRPARA